MSSREDELEERRNMVKLASWRSIGGKPFRLVVTAIGTLLLLEIILRFLPVAVAPAVEVPTESSPIQRYVANAAFTWSIGWDLALARHGKTNAQGFVADYDYSAPAPSPLIAVIGDSYIEALTLPFAQTLTGQLQAALGSRGRAYAFAQSGAPLSQYLVYARHACAVYRPERMAVSITSDDIEESLFQFRQRNGIFHLHPRPDGSFDLQLTPVQPAGWTERIARHSYLALYLLRNLGIGADIREWGMASAQSTDSRLDADTRSMSDAENPAEVAQGEKIISWFLGEIANIGCMPASAIVIVVDAMRPELYDDQALESAQSSYFGRMRRKILADATSHGFAVVDLEREFSRAFAKDGLTFEPEIDAHWNAHGHAIAAAAIEAKFADWMPFKAEPTH